MASRSQPSSLVVPKVIALVVLFGALVGFAVEQHASGQGTRGATASHEQLGSARVFAAADQLRELQVIINEAAASGREGSARGILGYTRRINHAPGPMPSTEAARPMLEQLANVDVISVSIDPRDWNGEKGIYDNFLKRGKNSHRGACLSMFAKGKLVAETTVGVCIHGGSSRYRSNKSLRLMLRSSYGATADSSDLLPGALGDSLVVHSDLRDLPFCNPIAYELMRRLGCDVPLTRPVKLLVNGESMRNVYFLTEHLSDSYLEEKLGHRQFVRNDERGGRSPVYAKRTWKIERSGATVADFEDSVDCDDLISWIAGVLFCAPYDNRQGISYLDWNTMRWRWVVWDLDWSFQPWPTEMNGEPVSGANVTEHMMHPWGDMRSTMFSCFMPKHGEFRKRMLARVSMMLNHELGPEWLSALVARYRTIASVYRGPNGHREELDQIEEFMRARPAVMRSELVDLFGAGPVYTCSVRVPKAASVIVDGHIYDQDITCHYFAGQEVLIRAAKGCVLRVPGSANEITAFKFLMDRNMSFEVIRR